MKNPREVAESIEWLDSINPGLRAKVTAAITVIIEARDAEAASGTVKAEDVARWLERRYGKRSMAPSQMRDGTWRKDLAWLDSIAGKEGT